MRRSPRRQALAVGEVEAQLVGPDVGAGLVDVVAQRARAAPRAAGAWRCGWPPSRGARRGRRGRRRARPRAGRARPRRPRRRSPGRRRSARRRRRATTQSPSAQAIVPVSWICPPPCGVERRLGELDERAPALLAHADDGGVLLEVLVAGERRRLAARGRLRRRTAPRAAAGARARALGVHERVELGSCAKGTPRSSAISRVSSIGKPNVSCRRKASSPETSPAASRSSSSLVPDASVRPKPSSSARTHLRIVSRPATSSG